MNQETAGPEAQRVEPVRNFSVLLSPTPRGARLARLLATEQLRSWELPLSPADQVVAELANNAATHGRVRGRDFRLTLYVVGDTLRIEVTDTVGDRLPRAGGADPGAGSGRGLLLVDAFAHRWGVTPGPAPRKTVWAELRLREPEHGGPCSGAACGLFQAPPGRKNPRQAPPLPPAARSHSPE
ncbi:ATP-binding protein [Streptomyces aureus]|uniref:ATP-binding protein n=1 Tax=Streptomyces aureus TaxID=193461 RepID=UPI000564018B|nr:ATP-binding protein [Streptomyces aureus]